MMGTVDTHARCPNAYFCTLFSKEMKRIADNRRLLGTPPNYSLKELNTLYKGLMKAHHPDRFPGDEAKRGEAEELSKKLIEAYKFLESIHPETHDKDREGFERTMASHIADWQYKGLTLNITFGDGTSYEFYGVQPKVYNKFVAVEGNTRFARRHIFGAHQYRKVANAVAMPA